MTALFRVATLSLVITITAVVGDSVAAPPATPGNQEQSRKRFLSLLKQGDSVLLLPVKNTSSYDLQIVARPRPPAKPVNLPYVVAGHGRDYVTLKRIGEVRNVPTHSIRSIISAPADPLSTPITAEFRRMPLQEFLGRISKAVGTEIRIDGEALKNSGYTKNMPQTISATKTKAEQLLAEVLQQYRGMVLTVHDGHLLLTTREFAKKRGEQIRELKPAKK